MSKKHFIELADYIRMANQGEDSPPFKAHQIAVLADFCQSQNPQFNRSRWLAYIAGECGPNGGDIKRRRAA